jgi:hypothetical protein
MENILTMLAAALPSSICAAAAFYMAVHNIEGWGWFLFVAFLVAGVGIKGSLS